VFLTPVFFYVIDWMSSTRFFQSPKVRSSGMIVLTLLTAGLACVPAVIRKSRKTSREDAQELPSAKDAHEEEEKHS
jgi:hypothetical protein